VRVEVSAPSEGLLENYEKVVKDVLAFHYIEKSICIQLFISMDVTISPGANRKYFPNRHIPFTS
jgi:hypothetical protein